MGFPSGSAVKNQPAMQESQEAWIPSQAWEDPLEESIATLLPGESQGQSLAGYRLWGHTESDRAEATWNAHAHEETIGGADT